MNPFQENGQYAGELYAIGDLQGCYPSLVGLLEQIPPEAPLVFVGDLVNRGPQSLETLRAVKDLSDSGRARCLLGNHDLHLLAVAAGHAKPHGKDTILPILEAPDRDELIDWLRGQKLAIYDAASKALFVHAAAHPSWDLALTLKLANEAEEFLSSDGWKEYLKDMYGPADWNPEARGPERMRGILNTFTRTRFVDKSTGALDFGAKGGPSEAGDGLIPWFDYGKRKMKDQLIVFGHWSMLGLMLRPNLIAIDTGCLWGGSLTAIRMRDRRIFTEHCPMWCNPGK